MLQVVESCGDHYNDLTELNRKATCTGITAVNFISGRFGGQGMRISAGGSGVVPAYMSWVLPTNEDKVYFGAAIHPSVGYAIQFEFTDAGSAQIGLRATMSGSSFRLQVLRGGYGGTVLWSSNYYPASIWHHIGAEFEIHNSTGTAKVWLNGEQIADLSGLDTQQTANAYANGFRAYYEQFNGGSSIYFDDLYAGDDTGSYNTAFLGDKRVIASLPNGDGSTVDWTASAGNDWDCVKDANPDDDTTYISSGTVDQKELFTFPDLPANVSSVNAVQFVMYSRKDDSETRALKTLVRSGGSDYEVGSAKYQAATYSFYSQIIEEDPQDSTAWTPADVNAAEFGIIVDV